MMEYTRNKLVGYFLSTNGTQCVAVVKYLADQLKYFVGQVITY